MQLINYILHFDRYLQPVIHIFGPYIYALFFFIIFAETGFVVTPFLPGDSLLFVAGSLAGAGYLNIWVTYVIFLSAAILGKIWRKNHHNNQICPDHTKFCTICRRHGGNDI